MILSKRRSEKENNSQEEERDESWWAKIKFEKEKKNWGEGGNYGERKVVWFAMNLKSKGNWPWSCYERTIGEVRIPGIGTLVPPSTSYGMGR